MAEDGEEKLLATVQHIVQTLGSSDTMTEDILKVFSNYDGRLSLDKLYAARAAAAAAASGGGGGGGAGGIGGEHSMPASPPPPLPPAAAATALSAGGARPPVTPMDLVPEPEMKIGDSPKGDGTSSPRAVMVERVAAFTGEVPMLPKVNYQEWALEMQVPLEGMEVWDAVETGCADRGKDRRALAVILRGVLPEMKSGLAAKKSVKEALDAVKKMHAGDDRMKDASIQRLMKQFDNLMFRDGESVGDFATRINGLITSLRELGEKLEDSRIVKKMLRVVPRKLKQGAVAIEMFGDLNNMSIEELVGRLQVVEDADAEEQEAVHGGNAGQLLLTEEQWEARHRRHTGKEQVRGCRNGHGSDRDDDDDDGSSSTSSGRGRSRYRGKCFDCGVRGHKARDFPKKKKKKKKKRALLVDVEEEAALL